MLPGFQRFESSEGDRSLSKIFEEVGMTRNDQNIAVVRRVFEAVYPHNGQVLRNADILRLGTEPRTLVGKGWAVPVRTQAKAREFNLYRIQIPPNFDIEEYLKEWKQNIVRDSKTSPWKDSHRYFYRQSRELKDSYYLLKWDAATEAWTITDKCFAYAYQGACKAWKIDLKTAQTSMDRRIVYGSKLKEYGIIE